MLSLDGTDRRDWTRQLAAAGAALVAIGAAVWYVAGKRSAKVAESAADPPGRARRRVR
ncbi:hypothetical protein [Sorangium cellulosum]|uniref:hypothetical protein n=1 Tax=Sorangium cellulosum TaxID=56 RepID=UPI0013319719|nr:hypothetical protein [Sorangium cellulosum]